MDPNEALEQLEKILEELALASRSNPIIVEGRWDKKALKELGVGGIIFVLNDGQSIIDTWVPLHGEAA